MKKNVLSEKTARFRSILILDSCVNGFRSLFLFITVSVLTVVMFDSLIHFTRFFRFCALLTLAAGVIYISRRKLYSPVSEFAVSENVARYLERAFPLNDIYRSVLFFEGSAAKGEHRYTDAMLARLRIQASDLIMGIPPARIIRQKHTLLNLIQACFILLGFFLVFSFVPGFRLGVARILFPAASYSWPSRTSLRASVGNTVHPSGAPLQLEVVAGGEIPKECVLILKDEEGTRTYPMVRFGKRFRYTVEKPMRTFTYRVNGGDTSTGSYTIRIAERPSVSSLQVVMDYPEYTGMDDASFAMENYNLHCVRGTELHFTGTASVPLTSAAVNGADGSLLAVLRPEGTEFSWSTVPKQKLVFSFTLTDGNGFTQKNPPRYHVWADADPAPSVKILKPGRNLNLIPEAAISVSISAADNFGIKDIGFSYASPDEEKITLREFDLKTTEDHELSMKWNLKELAFKEDTRVVIWGWAGDFNPECVAGTSEKVVLDIISKEELLALIQKDKVSVKKLVDDLAEAENSFITKAESGTKDDLYALEKSQQRIMYGIQNSAGDLFRLMEDLENNLMKETEDFSEVRSAYGFVRDASSLSAQAVNSLRNAGDRDVIPPESVSSARKVLELLEKARKEMADWELFETIVSKLGELIEKQEKLSKLTLDQSAKIPRRDASLLDKKYVSQLDEAAREQEGMKRVLESIEYDIEQAADVYTRGRKKDIFKNALTFLHEQLVYRKMESASTRIRNNRLFSAFTDQKNVISSLKELAEIISGKTDVKDELESVLKMIEQIGKLEKEAGDLLNEQKDINENLSEKDRKAAARKQAELREKMKKMMENLEELSQSVNSRDLNILRKLAESRDALQQAMESAAKFSEFMNGQNSEGGGEGKTAEQKLKEMQEKLRQAAKEAEKKKQDLKKDDIIETLKTVLELQKEIGEDIRKTGGGSDAERTREEIKVINDLAGRQTLNRNAVDAITKSIREKRELVFTWMLKNISDTMKEILEAFDIRDLTRPVQNKQDQVVADIELLLKSLEISRKEKNEAGGGGGGGGGGSGSSELLPPVYELKLIREIQERLSSETEQLFRDKPKPTVQELQQIKAKQTKLREFFNKLIEEMSK